jgi:hypothetical protein
MSDFIAPDHDNNNNTSAQSPPSKKLKTNTSKSVDKSNTKDGSKKAARGHVAATTGDGDGDGDGDGKKDAGVEGKKKRKTKEVVKGGKSTSSTTNKKRKNGEEEEDGKERVVPGGWARDENGGEFWEVGIFFLFFVVVFIFWL